MTETVETTAVQAALTRMGFAGMIVVATMAATFPWALIGTVAQLLAGAALVVFTIVAWRLRQANVLRALVFLDAIWAIFTIGGIGQLDWLPSVVTVLVCVVPLLCLRGCNRVRWLRPATPWLRWGQVTPGLIGFGVATVVLAGAALTTWAVVVRPEPAPYLLGLQQLPLWLGILGVIGFALVNPLWEEALFRGVVLEELRGLWGTVPAVITQAVLFGAAHWAGFPSGWIGMVMAGSWGLALGIIRVRSQGMGLTYVVHVGANAVIGTLALVLLV